MPGITMPPDASISCVPSGTSRLGADRLDLVADDQDVAVLVDRVAVVHGQHGAAAQDDRVGHGPSRTSVRLAVNLGPRVTRAAAVKRP